MYWRRVYCKFSLIPQLFQYLCSYIYILMYFKILFIAPARILLKIKGQVCTFRGDSTVKIICFSSKKGSTLIGKNLLSPQFANLTKANVMNTRNINFYGGISRAVEEECPDINQSFVISPQKHMLWAHIRSLCLC